MKLLKIELVLSLIFGVSYSQSVHTLSLDDAVLQVLAVSPQIKEAEHTVTAAKERVTITHSSDYPVANAELSYARVAPVSAAAFGPTLFQLNPANVYDGHIAIDAVVYDFDRRNIETEMSITGVQNASDRLDLLKENLSYRTVSMFYSILFVQKSINVHNQEIRNLQEHLEVVKKKAASGTATDFDVLTTQVRITAAKNKTIDLLNALTRTEIQLKEALQIPVNDSLALIGSFDAIHTLPADSSAYRQAISSRLEIHTAENAISSASLQKTLVGQRNYPTLNFHAAYGIKNGLFPNIDAWRGNYVAGLSLSIPVFDGFRKKYQEDEAEATINAAQEHKNAVLQQVSTEVGQAETDVQSNQQKVIVAQTNIEQAQKALDIAQVRYEAGTATNLDLLDAENSLTEAQFQKVQAQYHLVLSRYELLHAVGKTIYSK